MKMGWELQGSMWMPSLDMKYSTYYGFHFYGFINCENIQLYQKFQTWCDHNQTNQKSC